MKDGSGCDRWSLAKVKLLQCRVSRHTLNGTELHRTSLVFRDLSGLAIDCGVVAGWVGRSRKTGRMNEGHHEPSFIYCVLLL